MPYSIIIPIYNEERTLEKLLKSLEQYSHSRNQILIINDGSVDKTNKILKKYDFIDVLHLKKNYGKGTAIKIGLHKSIHNKTIIYDGDLELHTDGISELMRLDRDNSVYSILGQRFKKLSFLNSKFDWGNFVFTSFFNFVSFTHNEDVLCCAKSFFKKDIPLDKLKSKGFDIDIELSWILVKNNKLKRIKHIFLNYQRRSVKEGKKLKINDGWKILRRVISMI
jgi:dolichol-phosphate mannosyltransferase